MTGSAYKISYCHRWNFDRHQPIDPLAPDEAATREAYSVVLHDPWEGEIPEAVIEVAWDAEYAGVWFFDSAGLRSLNYAFRRTGDRLFLCKMTEYAGCDVTEEFTFQEDVASHWEPVPQFGDWDSLARWHRD